MRSKRQRTTKKLLGSLEHERDPNMQINKQELRENKDYVEQKATPQNQAKPKPNKRIWLQRKEMTLPPRDENRLLQKKRYI